MKRNGISVPRTNGSVYPLAALVGQERMKRALMLLAVDPDLGGVLLIGQKGTAKSTAVRALAEVLPPVMEIDGCHYHCDPDAPAAFCPDCRRRVSAGETPLVIQSTPPFHTLPLGATEDRVAGGLDIEQTTRLGKPVLKPGLLGQSNRGFLYVDEVNLLEPFLAHLLLDATVSGMLRVEREGVSIWHPSRAALIGSMNPEEGPLGPQFSDRFALVVTVDAEKDITRRKEIVRRRLAFEADPEKFRNDWKAESDDLTARIIESRKRLNRTGVSPVAQNLISYLAKENRASGHRADLAMARAARALAAWRGDDCASSEHVFAAAELALKPRSRPEVKKPVQIKIVEGEATEKAQHYESPYLTPYRRQEPPRPAQSDATEKPSVERIFKSNDVFQVFTPSSKRDQGPGTRSGRRTARKTNEARGRYYRSSQERLGRPLALDATMRAAAPHQNGRRNGSQAAFIIKNQDIREKVYRKKTGRLVLFVVDASGSVGSLDRMSEAKACALSLLSEAYQKRDKVGLISFNGAESTVLLPPTNSVEMASRLLEDLPTGGKTPFASAMVDMNRIVRMEMARDPYLTPLIVVMTDGRPNVPLEKDKDPFREALQITAQLGQDRRLKFLFVDTDKGHYADYHISRELAENLNAPRVTLEDLRNGRLEEWLEKVV